MSLPNLKKRFFLKNAIKYTCYFPLINFFLKENKLFANSKILKINMSDIPQIPWDIYQASMHVLSTFNLAVHGTLLQQKYSSHYLIEKLCISENNISLFLKKQVFFHNNREVNAYDVEFSIYKELLINPESNYIKSLLNSVTGIENLSTTNIEKITYDSIIYPSSFIAGIKVTSPYSLTISLKQYDHYFIAKLNTPRLPIVPIEELQSDLKNWKTFPVGFGPYLVYSANTICCEYILKKTSEYILGPQLIKLFFHDKEEADIYLLYRYRLKQKNNYFITKTLPQLYANAGFLYNFQTPLGQNIHFRKAISYALDRIKIAETVLFQEISPEEYLLPRHHIQPQQNSEPSYSTHNLILAQYHLNLVPKELWANKMLYAPTLLDFKNIETIPYLNEICTQLKKIGILIEFIETDIYYDKFYKNDPHCLWFTGFALQKANPIKNFINFSANSYFDYEHPHDSVYDTLLEKTFENCVNDDHYIKILNKYFKEQELMTIIFNNHLNLTYNSKTIKSIGKQLDSSAINLTEINIF